MKIKLFFISTLYFLGAIALFAHVIEEVTEDELTHDAYVESALFPPYAPPVTYMEMDSLQYLRRNIVDLHFVEPININRPLHELVHDWKVDFFRPDDCDCVPFTPAFVPDEVIIQRLQAMPTAMEMSFNPIVRSQIDAYANRRRDQVAHMLALSNYYFPIFEEALERHGLPLELRYLPVIESALNPIAVSRAGAAGLWQFMPATARGFGLEINTLVDERRCVHRSSEAAAQYLRDLYNIFGDWKLVLAAYNSGRGTVTRAIARSGGVQDYWAIYHNLPRETRGFVPIFIAAAYIMNYHSYHGICPLAVDPLFLGVDTVHVHQNLHFEQISHVLDIPLQDIQRLNPKFRQNIIPATENRPFALVLPSRSIFAFIQHQDSIYAHNRNQHFNHRVLASATASGSTTVSGNFVLTHHRVVSGENLSTIARRHGTTVANLRAWNNLSSDMLRIGQQLIVRRQPAPAQPALQPIVVPEGHEVVNQYHRVQRGDTLGALAIRYGTTVAQLQQWNRMTNTNLAVDRMLIVNQQFVEVSR